jgi:proteasome lid subunit RPN8/RPN11
MYKYCPNIYTADLDMRCVNAAINHAVDEFPNESCGAIINNHYIRFKNEAEDPLKEFIFDDDTWHVAYINGEVECLVHSHNDFNQASLPDQLQQRELCVPSMIINLRHKSLMDCIVFGDELPIAPLDGRPFFYGAFDCIALIYDYLRLNLNISIPSPPREWAFWMKGVSMFEEHLSTSKIPFYEIEFDEMRKDDVLLYNINGTKYINHIGILKTDRGEVYHHIYNTISGTYPINFNRKYLRKAMRFDPTWESSND